MDTIQLPIAKVRFLFGLFSVDKQDWTQFHFHSYGIELNIFYCVIIQKRLAT